jgi:GH15 family glucan-1,4-alpha-glucosidase
MTDDSKQLPDTPYPPIADYALISDCHCAALVSRAGSIDWCCMPRIDNDSCFGRMLDWERGGFCALAPEQADYTSSRLYLEHTMVLETRFCTPGGEVRLLDFFAMNEESDGTPRYQLVRVVEGVRGEVDMRLDLCPRFDYGEISPYIQQPLPGVFTAIGSNNGLIIHADISLEPVQHRDLSARFRLRAGEHRRLLIRFEYPNLIDGTIARGIPDPAAIDRYLKHTCGWWRDWVHRMQPPCEIDEQTIRSTLVLKALTFEPTGAIAAAATTSLPEWIGGERNWDYRFSWVRDSVFTVRALHELGFVREADRFHRFIQRSAAGNAGQMQIMYRVDGKRRLTEVELEWLEGYRQSRPVRIGNGAAKQAQLDIYGELLQMAWEWHTSGHDTESQYWDFLVDVIDTVCERWNNEDHGIWEVRSAPRHYVHSKVMCWATLNDGIRLATETGLDAPLARWQQTRDKIRAAVENNGYDAKQGIFVQTFGSTDLDAALLMLPRVGFVAYDDPRMLRTTDAICRELDRDGLLLRYTSPDGLRGPEGMFLPCTFWLATCLAYQGRIAEAQRYYDRAASCANDLGLFSEEFDTGQNQMLGNFPQGLTHVSQIMARLAIAGVE